MAPPIDIANLALNIFIILGDIWSIVDGLEILIEEKGWSVQWQLAGEAGGEVCRST